MPQVATIDLRIARIEALFESLDPSPFHDRDLDPKAVDYILGWAQEHPKDAQFLLRLHLPADEAQKVSVAAVGTAIRANFGYWTQSVERSRREQFRQGRRYLMIGMTVLALCLLARQAVPKVMGDTPFARFVAEGLSILGWVANWKPAETFLYDWWPLYRRLTLYRRLAAANVEIVAVAD